MGSYHGPKAKQQRRFGEVLVPRPKYQRILEKRAYPPGDHGKEKQFRSGRRSDYGLQLNEKQKLAFIYNVREKQLRSYFLRARRQPGNTGDNLMILLERRLDNLVYRAGFAPTIWAARQLVKHGHINVDDARLDLPSYQCSPGQKIAVNERMRKNEHVMMSMDESVYTVPYLSVDRDSFTATFLAVPERTEIPIPIQDQLIVEYYTRLT
ncbi:MAG: 30S ribosomal protein S4 [Chloroflexi bacterium]|nr:30S ribosomal protein S4 [Chloroflexota bacterium]